MVLKLEGKGLMWYLLFLASHSGLTVSTVSPRSKGVSQGEVDSEVAGAPSSIGADRSLGPWAVPLPSLFLRLFPVWCLSLKWGGGPQAGLLLSCSLVIQCNL